MPRTRRVSQLAAKALLALLILVPATALILERKTSLAWLVWTVVSLWATLNGVKLTMLIFPERHSPKSAIVIIMLAAVNVAFSLALALMPNAWLSTSP